MRPLQPDRYRRVSSAATVTATLLAGTGLYLIVGLYFVFEEFRAVPVVSGIALTVAGIAVLAAVGRLRIEGQAQPSDRPPGAGSAKGRREDRAGGDEAAAGRDRRAAAEEWEPR